MKVTADTPVPLILDALEGNVGWKVLKERIADVRDKYMLQVRMAPPTADARELQRWLGIAEGLDRVLRDPMMLEREWKAERERLKKKAEAERLRAEDYARIDG